MVGYRERGSHLAQNPSDENILAKVRPSEDGYICVSEDAAKRLGYKKES